MIPRAIAAELERLKSKFPVLALTGPRQAGKTTLLKHLFPDYHYLSLENPDVREHALKDPNGLLNTYPEKTIFDEAQRAPQLFSYIQTLADESGLMGQFILSGLQNFLLMQNITQSLAGRVALLRIFPFTFPEMHAGKLPLGNLENVIFTGFYPSIFDRQLEARDFYPNYVETYLERDVQSVIMPGNMRQFQTFMRLCAGHVGQLVNYSSLADGCGISVPTAKTWLSVLERSYILFLLQPYHRNFNKRLVKTPKIYFYDTGLACYLLNINDPAFVGTYYQKGSLLENLIIAELVKQAYHLGMRPAYHFWRDNHQNEIDLIWEENLKMNLLEIKYSQTLSGHFFAPFHKFKSFSGIEPEKQILVYGGTQHLKREGIDIRGWRETGQW